MKFALLPGSLRTDSLNKKLAKQIAQMLNSQKHEAILLDLRSLSIPLYDGDMEVKEGLPKGIVELDKNLKNAHGIIVVTPEYNFSIPGVLKNAIDWLSRVKPHAFVNKPVLLLAASPGGFGGLRSLMATRQVIEGLGAYVFPEMMAVPKAHEVFAENGFNDTKLEERISKLLTVFGQYTTKFI